MQPDSKLPPWPSCGFSIALALILLLGSLLLWGWHFYARAVSLPDSAIATLVDELVELHREALTGAGDARAPYMAWHLLRNQFVILSVQARAMPDGHRFLRVRLWSNSTLAAHPPTTLHYTLTPIEDDAWEITPSPSALPFWLR